MNEENGTVPVDETMQNVFCDLGCVEMAVFEQECLRIVFRAPATTECKPYIFQRSLSRNSTVDDLIARVKQSTDIPFVIVDGNGNTQHLKRKRLAVIAMSYPC